MYVIYAIISQLIFKELFRALKTIMHTYIKMLLVLFVLFYISSPVCAQYTAWPVLKSYDSDHTQQLALPIGGIGTGTVSLTGRGELTDWEIVNRAAIGFKPSPSFVALYAKAEGEAPVTKMAEGQVSLKQYIGNQGSTADFSGIPRFQQHSFAAAYPFGQVFLEDSSMPLDVTIQAFNPLVPGDVDASSIPVAVFRYILINKTSKKVDAGLCFNLQNFIGTDGKFGTARKNTNVYQVDDQIQGIYMSSQGIDSCDERFGSIAITTKASNTTSYRTSWIDNTLWFQTHVLNFWEDFSKDGKLDQNPAGTQDSPAASLAVNTTLAPKDSTIIEFYLTWYFPNRQKMTWDLK